MGSHWIVTVVGAAVTMVMVVVGAVVGKKMVRSTPYGTVPWWLSWLFAGLAALMLIIRATDGNSGSWTWALGLAVLYGCLAVSTALARRRSLHQV